MKQLYAKSDLVVQHGSHQEPSGNGRFRLWKKTPPGPARWGTCGKPPMPDGADVKIGQLPEYHSTIVAAISKYPHKRANALSTVLNDEYGLLVKWKALQTYVLRQNLWTVSRPTPAVPKTIVVVPATSAASSSRRSKYSR